MNLIKILPLLFTLACMDVSAQYANLNSISFNKKSYPGITANYAMPVNILEEALKNKMNELNPKISGKKKEGFLVYQGAVIPAISDEKMDYYFKWEEKSPSASALSVLISSDPDNFSPLAADSEPIKKGLQFLNDFNNELMKFGFNKIWMEQLTLLKEAEKGKSKIIKNGETLEKEKQKTEKKISESRSKQAKLSSNVENQKRTLETVKNKTGTVDEMNAIKKEIKSQENEVDKAGKNFEKEQENERDLIKDLEKIVTKLAENKTEQVNINQMMQDLKEKAEEYKNHLDSLK